MFKKKSTREMAMQDNKRRDTLPANEDYPDVQRRTAPLYDEEEQEPEEAAVEPGVPERWIRKNTTDEPEPIIPAERVEKPEHPKIVKPIKEKPQSENTHKEKPQKEKHVRERIKSTRPPEYFSEHFYKNKAFWGLTSIILALLIAFVIMPAVQNNITQKVTVVAAAKDIPEGTKIESNMLQKMEFSKSDLPADAIMTEEAAVGKYAGLKLLAGDILTSAKVADTYIEDPYLYDIPNGKMAISVELSNLAQSVSGKLRSGDVVRIFAVYKKNSNTESVNASDYSAHLIDELQYVEVLAVTNSNVQDIQGGESTDSNNASATNDTKDNKTIATVTLLVNNKQAEVLAGLNNSATLYSALVVRGDEAKKKTALDSEEKYFESEVATK